MRFLFELVLYIVGGGILAFLGLMAGHPSLTNKQLIGWVCFILFGAPLLLLLACVLLGINL